MLDRLARTFLWPELLIGFGLIMLLACLALAARAVSDLWSRGDREAAAQRVPIEIGLRTNLIGDDRSIADRLRLYRDVGIDNLRVGVAGETSTERLDQIARLLDIVSMVNAE